MANPNTRFIGTYEFEEIDRFHGNNGRPLPLSSDRLALCLKLTGELQFEVNDLKGKITIDRSKPLASGDYTDELHKEAVAKFKQGGVDKLIKEIIISAIRDFKDSRDNKTIEEEYKQLISGITKYSIELNVKSKDL